MNRRDFFKGALALIALAGIPFGLRRRNERLMELLEKRTRVTEIAMKENINSNLFGPPPKECWSSMEWWSSTQKSTATAEDMNRVWSEKKVGII